MDTRNPQSETRTSPDDANEGLTPNQFESRIYDAAEDVDPPDATSGSDRDIATLPTCKYCGKGLINKRQKDPHEAMCPENPDRQNPGQNENAGSANGLPEAAESVPETTAHGIHLQTDRLRNHFEETGVVMLFRREKRKTTGTSWVKVTKHSEKVGYATITHVEKVDLDAQWALEGYVGDTPYDDPDEWRTAIQDRYERARHVGHLYRVTAHNNDANGGGLGA